MPLSFHDLFAVSTARASNGCSIVGINRVMNEALGIRFIVYFVRLWEFIRPKTHLNRLGRQYCSHNSKKKNHSFHWRYLKTEVFRMLLQTN